MLWLLLATAALAGRVEWDEARWLVRTEVEVPVPVRLERADGGGVDAVAWQLDAVLACDVVEARRRRAEVRCAVEDAALRAASEPPHAAATIVEGLRALLLGGTVEVGVDDTGRIRHLSLHEVPDDDPTELNIARTLRMMLDRGLVGLDWRRPGPRDRATGQWVAYDVALATLPALSDARPMGTVAVLHQPDDDALTLQGSGSAVWFGTNLALSIGVSAVARFDGEALTSRIWEVQGEPRAGGGRAYRHRGLIRRLGPDERPDLGPTGEVSPPGQPIEGLPAWPALAPR